MTIKRLVARLVYGLIFALPLMLVSFAFAHAKQMPQENQPEQLVCKACHGTFQKAWEGSAHGQAGTDPAFREAWLAQGEPGKCLECHVTGYDPDLNTWESEAITCNACHDADTANHPMQPMAANRSAKLCGDCHQETYFEWQVSSHRESGLDCVGCHDPHATSLKKDDPAGQCASCHRSRASNYAHSEHSKQGLACSDCHLAELRDSSAEGHARLDHSFSVRLSTCNSCHAYQMHDPSEVHPERPTPMPADALAAVETLSVLEEPIPVSPVGFATLSGLFGLAAGAILAPWIERRYRKNDHKDE